MWNAADYDNYYKAFSGAVDDKVDWELLKPYLPQNKRAYILDAAGGTGRITLRLAKLGYQVTLCDLSPEMLKVAREKMQKNDVLHRVEFLECNINRLPYPDERFDLVLCWDGAFESKNELIRVTKKGGIISLFLANKWAHVINDFYEKPDKCLILAESNEGIVMEGDEPYVTLSVGEARNIFNSEGIRVIDIYAVCGWTDYLSIPDKILKSHEWDNKLFEQTIAFVLRLSKEPSIKGMTRHLVLYGEKI